jgi:hypothetical protein
LNDQPSWSLASVGTTSNFQIFNDATGQNAVLIDRTNKVGIGTTTPGQKLSVAGVIESTSGGVKFPDGTVQDGAVGPTYTILRTDGGFLPGTAGPVLHLTLPNGTYLVESTLEIHNGNFIAINNNRQVSCGFSAENLRWNMHVDGEHVGLLDIHSIVTVSSGGLDVLCRVNLAPTNVFVLSRRMTAIRLGGTVSVQ